MTFIIEGNFCDRSISTVSVDSLITPERVARSRALGHPQIWLRSGSLNSLFSRKVRLFGHFEQWSVDSLSVAVSKLQTSASAGEDFELAP
jgi:hypothetical protein